MHRLLPLTLATAAIAALAALASAPAGAAVTLQVPSQYSTIQAAVNAAHAGDTILVAPGSYQEKVWVKNHQTGLTIAAANAANPPTILGTPNASLDGIRVDSVDGVHFTNLRIVGAYDGVRLNNVHNALLDHLYIENSALGVRFYNGDHNTLRNSTVNITRVEQGVLIDHSGFATVDNVSIAATYVDGIKVSYAPSALLHNVRTDGAKHAADIYVTSSLGASVIGSSATNSGVDGFRVSGSNTLVFSGNNATFNKSAGIRIQSSPPFATVADVSAAGNTASGNGSAQIVVTK